MFFLFSFLYILVNIELLDHVNHLNEMYSWLYWYLLLLKFIIIEVIANTAHIRSVDAQQNERIRLECKLSSKLDAEEVRF